MLKIGTKAVDGWIAGGGRGGMVSSSGSSDTTRLNHCFLNGFCKEIGWIVAYEVKQKHMKSTIMHTSTRSVGVTMCASGTLSAIPAMLLWETSPSMLVSWAKSTALTHIGSEGVAAPKSSNRIDSPSKFIVIANIRYQSKTIRGTKYYNRYQYSKTYCSYVHLIQILRDLHSGEMSVKFFARQKNYSNFT